MKILVVYVCGGESRGETERELCVLSAVGPHPWRVSGLFSFQILSAWTDTNVKMTSSLNEIRWIL